MITIVNDNHKNDIRQYGRDSLMQMANVGYRSDCELTKDTPYLALSGELWSVFCGYFGER